MLNKIGIFGKVNGNQSWQYIVKVIKHFQAQGKVFYLDSISCKEFPAADYNVKILERDALLSEVDLTLVIGGDGSFLNAARSVVEFEVPIVGINLGRIGFLTDVTPENMLNILDDIFQGIYDCEERNLLHIKIEYDNKVVHQNIAFNDVVMHKSNSPKMIEFETFIDDKFFCSQRSDGLIISTPTGSTAYALSAGGSILMPEIDAISLVSINPYTISNRPVIIAGTSKVSIIPHKNCQGTADIICDGQKVYTTNHSHITKIVRYDKFIKMLHPKGHDHFNILRSKLGWGT